MATTLTFDYDLFKVQIPEYSDPTQYPESTLQVYWDIAINYVSDVTCGSVLSEAAQQFAINLMTAHLVYLNGLIAAQQVPGLMQGATIDKITVALTPPPLRNQFSWWLNQSPRGQQLDALLQISSVGGFYIGGTPTRFGVYPSGTLHQGCSC